MKKKTRFRYNGFKIPGTVEITYKDEHGKRMFEWKRNRSGSNVEDGIYEFFSFIKEKMSVDLLEYMENMQQNINTIRSNTTNINKKEKKEMIEYGTIDK